MVKFDRFCPLKSNEMFHEIQDFTLIDRLLKLASSTSIFINTQMEKLFKVIFLWYSILIIIILSLSCHMKNTNIFTFFPITQIH